MKHHIQWQILSIMDASEASCYAAGSNHLFSDTGTAIAIPWLDGCQARSALIAEHCEEAALSSGS